MKKTKKLMCLILSVIMLLSINIPTLAVDMVKTAEETAENSGTMKNGLEIEVTTDKGSYKALDIAKINVTVTNTSENEIKNVSAETVFTDLAPVKGGSTTAETETLKAGESLTFSYKATLKISEHKLNIFQKIFLWFIRLFNGGYTASDNDFDNGRDCTQQAMPIIFGKFQADNVIRVWYGENGSETPDNPTTKDKTYEELINGDDIDEIYNYDESDISVDEETGIEYINNILLIIFEDDCTEERKAEIINSINGTVVGGRDWANELHIRVKKSTLEELETLCDKLLEVEGVLDVEYDEIQYLSDNSTSYIPNDNYIIDANDDNSNAFNSCKLAWNNYTISNALQLSYRNWYHLAIQTPEAWKYNEYFNHINVGIIDSGFKTDH